MAHGKTRLHVVASVIEFRRLAARLVEECDTVLEVGASTGETTTILAKKAKSVVAIEKGPTVTTQLRAATGYLENVSVYEMDAFDVGAVFVNVPEADVVFIDVGGNAPIENTVGIARIYRAVYAPREMVIRSIVLNGIVSMVASHEAMPDWRASDVKSLSDLGSGVLGPLLALTEEDDASVRWAAATALGRVESIEAVRCLVYLLDDRDSGVRKASAKSLREKGPQIRDDVHRLLYTGHLGEQAKREVIQILESKAFRRYIPPHVAGSNPITPDRLKILSDALGREGPFEFQMLGRHGRLSGSDFDYFIKCFEAGPDEDTANVLTTQYEVNRHLVESGVKTPKIVSTAAGEPFARIDTNWFQVWEFIEDDGFEPNNLDAVRAAGRALGEFHRATAGFSSVSALDEGDFTTPCAERIRELCDKVRTEHENDRNTRDGERLAADLEWFEDCAARCDREIARAASGDLPQSLVHGRFTPEHVLWQRQTVAGIVGYGGFSRGVRVSDIACALVTFVMDFSHVWGPLGEFTLRKAKSFVEGYKEVHEIASCESAVIPALTIRYWLTCYLQLHHTRKDLEYLTSWLHDGVRRWIEQFCEREHEFFLNSIAL